MRYNILDSTGRIIAHASTKELAEMVRDCDETYTIEDSEAAEEDESPPSCLKCGWDGKMTKVFLHGGSVRVSCPDCGHTETHSPEDGD